jgi:hypothetical protein
LILPNTHEILSSHSSVCVFQFRIRLNIGPAFNHRSRKAHDAKAVHTPRLSQSTLSPHPIRSTHASGLRNPAFLLGHGTRPPEYGRVPEVLPMQYARLDFTNAISTLSIESCPNRANSPIASPIQMSYHSLTPHGPRFSRT